MSSDMNGMMFPEDNPNEVRPGLNGAEEEAEQEEFDYSGFQIVRREFFAHVQEPSITFNQGKVGVNTACVRKLPDTDYVQILVNRAKKMLVVRPCEESEIHSFLWCLSKDGKKHPRQVTGNLFFMKICDMMGWNAENRYKVMGKMVKSMGQSLFVFDLTAAETFVRKQEEGEKPKTSRMATYQASWKDQFGIPFEERQQALQINMFEGYAIYAIKGKPEEQNETPLLPDPKDEHPDERQEGGSVP